MPKLVKEFVVNAKHPEVLKFFREIAIEKGVPATQRFLNLGILPPKKSVLVSKVSLTDEIESTVEIPEGNMAVIQPGGKLVISNPIMHFPRGNLLSSSDIGLNPSILLNAGIDIAGFSVAMHFMCRANPKTTEDDFLFQIIEGKEHGLFVDISDKEGPEIVLEDESGMESFSNRFMLQYRRGYVKGEEQGEVRLTHKAFSSFFKLDKYHQGASNVKDLLEAGKVPQITREEVVEKLSRAGLIPEEDLVLDPNAFPSPKVEKPNSTAEKLQKSGQGKGGREDQ